MFGLNDEERVKQIVCKSLLTRQKLREILELDEGNEANDMLIYLVAFIHRSMQRHVGMCQERLEFLGDAIINLLVAELLYHKFPDADEGVLTKYRTRIVKGDTLSFFAKKLDLESCIVLSSNAQSLKKSNEQSFKRVCEDTFEALVGALFLDKGICACRIFLMKLLNNSMLLNELLEEDNFKELLSKYGHEVFSKKPKYEVSSITGPAHQRQYQVLVKFDNKVYGEATALSKKGAEMAAARNAVQLLRNTNTSVIEALS